MQKISPLRSSIEAFNKFRASRAAKEVQKQETQTNPFGMSFKGTVIQMDVFEHAQKLDSIQKQSALKEKLQNANKLLASAWVATINKFSSLKANAIAFAGKIKASSVELGSKIKQIATTPVEFDLFKYSVSNLEKQPVSELKAMLTTELKGVMI